MGLALVALMLGEFPVSPRDALAVAVGAEQGPARLVLVEFRLPRLLVAVLVGMALGTAGALFQSVLRNPLASPDIIGVSQGAAVGAVIAVLGLGLAGLWISAAAWLGALTVAVLNLAVAWRGGLAGRRFVLCGIALSFACASVTSYLLARGDVREAHTVLLWLAGSVGSATYDDLVRLACVVGVLVPFALLLETRLAMLELGEDTAAGLGVPATRTRVTAIVLAVGLAASAVAVAGPIGFVALTAGPIARRLVGDGKPVVVASALVGAAVTLGADVIAEHLAPGSTVPVGVVTGLIGGPYLFWLLTQSREVRRSS
ncbi:iron ABC transporter permease [Haloechinothrix salitolerans]|uniref:FecCD family ABC transporter permease n=1 Tax=Haloechinothrix salitolerans TaxID=926830 RepID=A0ABW2C4E3_9PSEU